MRNAAESAAALLRTMGSGHRLMILCALIERPMTVSEICEAIGARQSLVSQHLIRLRQDKLVVAERRGQFVHYSMTDDVVRQIVAVLQNNFCPDVGKGGRRN